MFKFKKEDRVNVPGTDAQGVVLDVVENIPGFPVYTVTWLSEIGDKLLGSCGEGDLISANPEATEAPTDYTAIKLPEGASSAEIVEFLDQQIEGLRGARKQWARTLKLDVAMAIERDRARARKPARKSKPKRKR